MYRGLVAAALTPFTKEGKLDLNKIPELAEYYLTQPLAGLFVCGSNGECSSMSEPERKDAAEAFISAINGRMPVIVHVGSNSVEVSAELAEHAQKCGAQAISAVAPCYFRPGSVDILVECFARVAAAADKLPFYYYHIPALTNVNFPVLDFLKTADGRIPTLAGVKFTYENLMDFQMSLNYKPEKYQVMFGRDEIMIAGLAMGAQGAVGGTFNYAAPLYDNLMKAFNAGDLEEARRLQLLSQQMICILGSYGGSCGKMAMKLMGVDIGCNRLPQSGDMSGLASMAAELKQIGVDQYLGNKIIQF